MFKLKFAFVLKHRFNLWAGCMREEEIYIKKHFALRMIDLAALASLFSLSANVLRAQLQQSFRRQPVIN